MRKPDSCSLLTSWHLLCPNCPLVLFLFSLSLFLFRVSYGHRKLHPARPLVRREQVPRARSRVHTHVGSLASFSLLSSFLLSFLPCLFCFIWTLGVYYFNPVVRTKTTQGDSPILFIILIVLSLSKTSGNFAIYLLFYLTFIINYNLQFDSNTWHFVHTWMISDEYSARLRGKWLLSTLKNDLDFFFRESMTKRAFYM